MTHVEAVRLLAEDDFRNIVNYWLMRAAQDVHNESGGTPLHTERLALAKKIETNLSAYVDQFGWRCVLNATISGRPDLATILANEADVQFVINSEYNAFLGSGSESQTSASPVVVSGILTRPANTTAYLAGDELTDVSGSILAIPGCARVTGGAGVLDTITVIDAANAATDPVLDVFVFDTVSTPQVDNNPFAPTDAVMSTLVTALGLGTAIAGDAAASGNIVFQARNLCLPFVCGVGSTSLFVRLAMRNAYVPTSGEVFTVRLGIRQF